MAEKAEGKAGSEAEKKAVPAATKSSPKSGTARSLSKTIQDISQVVPSDFETQGLKLSSTTAVLPPTRLSFMGFLVSSLVFVRDIL